MKILGKSMGTGEDIKRRKRELRKEILARRDALTAEYRKAANLEILKEIISSACYQNASAVLTYASYGSEVGTDLLMEDAWRSEKAVYCPRVEGEEISFYRIFSFSDLETGYRGIREPIEGLWAYEANRQDENGLLVLPGTVFDRKRNRLGYGKGFYDRFLAGHLPELENGRIVTAGLAFSVQVVERVPNEGHDIRPDYLFTETEIL